MLASMPSKHTILGLGTGGMKEDSASGSVFVLSALRAGWHAVRDVDWLNKFSEQRCFSILKINPLLAKTVTYLIKNVQFPKYDD